MLTKEQYESLIKTKINPLTGRLLKENATTYKKLVNDYLASNKPINLSIDKSNKPSTSFKLSAVKPSTSTSENEKYFNGLKVLVNRVVQYNPQLNYVHLCNIVNSGIIPNLIPENSLSTFVYVLLTGHYE